MVHALINLASFVTELQLDVSQKKKFNYAQQDDDERIYDIKMLDKFRK